MSLKVRRLACEEKSVFQRGRECALGFAATHSNVAVRAALEWIRLPVMRVLVHEILLETGAGQVKGPGDCIQSLIANFFV